MAARYWVGGAATWDNTAGTKWALTSGGAGGQAVPTAADDVFFTAASGANIVTIGITAQALTLTMTGFTGTLAFSTNKIQLSGNATTIFTGATTYSVTGTPLIESIYSGTTGTRTINTTTVTEANSISFNITAGGGTVALGATNRIRSLDFTGYTGTASNGINTCTFFGSLTLVSGMTFTSSTAVWTFGATSGTQVITSAAGLALGPITQNNPGATLQLNSNVTLASTRTFTFTAGTLDLANNTLSTGLFSSSNSNVRSILFGTGNITVTGSGASMFNMSGSNLIYTGTPTVNISNNSAIASTITASNFTESSAFNFNITIGTYTLTAAASAHFKTILFTGFTGTWLTGSSFVYGDVTLVSGMSVTATGAMSFSNSSGIAILTSASKQLFTISRTVAGGTLRLADDLYCTGGLTVTAGVFDANNKNLTFATFSSSNSNVRTILMGSGTWTLNGVALIVSSMWFISNSTNMTLDPGTSTIVLANPSTHDYYTFQGGGLTYYNLQLGSPSNFLSLDFTGNNTFNAITSTKTVFYKIQITQSETITATTLSLGGTSGNLCAIRTTTNTTAFLSVINPFTLDYSSIDGVTINTSNGTVTNGYIRTNANNWTYGTGTQAFTVITSTVASSWTVPSGFTSSNEIHIFGSAGGGSGGSIGTVTTNRAGGAGGGGAGYAKLINQPYMTGDLVPYDIGSNGGAGNGVSGGGTSTGGNGDTTLWDTTVTITGGTGGITSAGLSTTPGSGGVASGGILNYSGGNGGSGGITTTSANGTSAGGGGGSAGPFGNGANGGNGISNTGAAVGGGGGGGPSGGSNGAIGTTTLGGDGGNLAAGYGGGVGTNSNGTPGFFGGGFAGGFGTASSTSSANSSNMIVGLWGGSGGAGGGGTGQSANSNSLYGGGGGGGGVSATPVATSGSSGRSGVIIIIWVPAGVIAVDITENSSIADILNIYATYSQNIIEDNTLTEDQSISAQFAASQTENVNIDDLKTVVAQFINSVTEATTLEDVTQAGLVFTDSIIENFTVASVESIQATFVRLVTENINAADLNSVKTDYITAVFENVGLLDIICYNGWFKIDDNQSASWTAISTPGGAWVGVNDAQTPSWTTISTPAGAWTDINDSQTANWDTIDTKQPCS